MARNLRLLQFYMKQSVSIKALTFKSILKNLRIAFLNFKRTSYCVDSIFFTFLFGKCMNGNRNTKKNKGKQIKENVIFFLFV